jgi:hypothetical protein
MATGLRLDVGKLKGRLNALKSKTAANEFRPELERFASRTLADCIQATPVRALSVIESNQRKQYEHRINYIPSFHTLEDPTLIVNDAGEEWIYAFGKWHNAAWHLRDEVWGIYMDLSQERMRRVATMQSDFVNGRAQARFLYQRSWWQVAQSLGLALSVAAAIIESHSRRKPRKEPPKAYGQWRGGKNVLAVVIVNPFLEIAGKYWRGNGKAILAQATAKNRARFYKECSDKVKREISAARRT